MTSVSLVIQSDLANAIVEMYNNPQLAEQRIQFVKFLISKYPNLNTKISDDDLINLWDECLIF